MRILISITILFYNFANKIIMFQEALQFHSLIVLCYNRQIVVKVISQIHPTLIWQISHIIMDFFFQLFSYVFQSINVWTLAT
jgi:hypothetical protein